MLSKGRLQHKNPRLLDGGFVFLKCIGSREQWKLRLIWR